MSGTTIKRGARGGRTTSRGSANGRGGRPKVRQPGLVEQAIAAIPMSRERLAQLLTWAIFGLFAFALFMVARFLGLPAMVADETSRLAARAGFQVAQVKVIGVERMDEMEVYGIALGEIDRSMLSLDLADLRQRIMSLGYVKDARISRRLPDTLVVDIVERQPAAVWQNGGRLSLIDDTGAVLSAVDERSVPDLPLVVGPNANRMTAGLDKLMASAPALKPMIAGATWVGNRRWDLRFQSGETLALPEGDAQAAAALVNFARMDGVDRLLGRGILRFDMRDPAKFVLRMPSEGRAMADEREIAAARPIVPGAPPPQSVQETQPVHHITTEQSPPAQTRAPAPKTNREG
jgi:cell division protein FtsQ